MPPDTKSIILASRNEKLRSWTLTIRRVVRQQSWEDELFQFKILPTDPIWIYQRNTYEN